jgi:hypothetical protein
MHRVIVFVAMLAIGGCQPSGSVSPSGSTPKGTVPVPSKPTSTKTAEKKKEVVVVHRASEIYDEYKHNEAGADLKYLDRTIECIAAGVSVEKNTSGQYMLIDFRVDPPPEGTNPGIVFVFLPSSTSKLAASKDRCKYFKIRGTCKGKTKDQGAWEGYRVTFTDCEIVYPMRLGPGPNLELIEDK